MPVYQAKAVPGGPHQGSAKPGRGPSIVAELPSSLSALTITIEAIRDNTHLKQSKKIVIEFNY
jgi:hypothetical protein